MSYAEEKGFRIQGSALKTCCLMPRSIGGSLVPRKASRTFGTRERRAEADPRPFDPESRPASGQVAKRRPLR
jgi:hypothetical protein